MICPEKSNLRNEMVADAIFASLYIHLTKSLSQKEYIEGLRTLSTVLRWKKSTLPKEFELVSVRVIEIAQKDPHEDIALHAVDVLLVLLENYSRVKKCAYKDEGDDDGDDDWYCLVVNQCVKWATDTRGPKALRTKSFQIITHFGRFMGYTACQSFVAGVAIAILSVLGRKGDPKCGPNVVVAALQAWEAWIQVTDTATVEASIQEQLAALSAQFSLRGENKQREQNEQDDDQGARGKAVGTRMGTDCNRETAKKSKKQEALDNMGLIINHTLGNKDPLSCLQTLAKEHRKVRETLIDFLRTALSMHSLSLEARQTCADALASLTQTDVAETAKACLREQFKSEDLRTHLQNRVLPLLQAAVAPYLSAGELQITRATGYLAYMREVCEPLVIVDDLLPPIFRLCAFKPEGTARDVFSDQHTLVTFGSPIADLTEVDGYDQDVRGGASLRSTMHTSVDMSVDAVRGWLHQAMRSPGALVDVLLTEFVCSCDQDLLFHALTSKEHYSKVLDDDGLGMEENQAVENHKLMESSTSNVAERLYVLATLCRNGVSLENKWSQECLDVSVDVLSQPHIKWNRTPLVRCTALFLLRAALESMDPSSVDRAMCRIFLPVLVQLGCASLVCSTAALGILDYINQRLLGSSSSSCCDADNKNAYCVTSLLTRYGDYVVDDLCFRLKFNAKKCDLIPGLTLAVTGHMTSDSMPFLKDIVSLLLRLRVTHKTTPWVIRSLAHVVGRLAGEILDSRSSNAHFIKEPIENREEESTSSDTTCCSPLLTFFTSGAWETKRPRVDGFVLTDLSVFNEDPAPREEQEEDQANVLNPPRDSSRYGEQRALARGIIDRARYHLADTTDVHVRHLAHVCVHHAMIILSTRIDDLLPAIHAVWESLLNSLSPRTSERIRVATLQVLRVISRFSGEFLHGRMENVLPAPLLSGGSPSWRGKILDVLHFWAQDDEFLSQKMIPHVLRYAAGELNVAENKTRAEQVLECVGAHNPGMLAAAMLNRRGKNGEKKKMENSNPKDKMCADDDNDTLLLHRLSRRPRIPLTPSTDAKPLLGAIGA